MFLIASLVSSTSRARTQFKYLANRTKGVGLSPIDSDSTEYSVHNCSLLLHMHDYGLLRLPADIRTARE
jgi:hypothetical protein